MKKRTKLLCSLLLSAAMLAGTLISGCAQSTDYTEEIKEYQAKLESLQAENEQLRQQLEVPETESEETKTQDVESEAVTEQETETAKTQEQETQEQEMQDQEQTDETESCLEESGLNPQIRSLSGALDEDGETKVLILGDSIWGNERGRGSLERKFEYYLELIGYDITLYNAAIGGTRATIDKQDSEWTYGPGSENSLGKMVSILRGDTDVEQLQGILVYDVMKEAIAVRDEIDLVILCYGMNDFLAQVPTNDSERPWTGYGTAMEEGVKAIQSICPDAEIMLIAPNYASYFSIPIQNMGEKALYNYASIACDVAKKFNLLCVDAYNQMGIGLYTADQYLEDGVHLNEAGAELYAMAVINALLYGEPGTVSGNSIPYADMMAAIGE